MAIYDTPWGPVVLCALLAGCCVGPGLFFVRWLRWTALETLCASVATSIFLVYLGSLAIYALNIRQVAAAHWILSGACAALSVACWRDFIRLIRWKSVRRPLGAVAVLWGWCCLLLMLIRHYSGGTWSGDWFEHYQRSQFFIEHWNFRYQFLGEYSITVRPPVMNLFCAHFLAQVGERFGAYQVMAALLGVISALPCCLLANWVSGRSRAAVIAVLVCLLAANPMFVENATFPWTKALAAFFVLVAMVLYLRGGLHGDTTRIVAAFAVMAAGCLVHFYVIAFAAAMAVHYLAVARRGWREATAIAFACAAVWATWFSWTISVFGFRTTFAANTTVSNPVASGFPERIRLITGNFVDTLVPYPFRAVPYGELGQHDRIGWIRDLIFCLYQTNAIFAFGLVGSAVLLFGVGRWNSDRERTRRLLKFGWIYVLVSVAVGISLVPMPEVWGAAQLCLQPLVLAGLAIIAGNYRRLGQRWQIALLLGVVVDFLAGVLLQVWVEHRTFEFVRLIGQRNPVLTGPIEPSHAAQYNAMLKQLAGLKFMGDGAAGATAVLVVFILVAFAVIWLGMARAQSRLQRN